MTKKIENSVGLEAEYFLRNVDGELLIPREHSLADDDYILLGEIRGAKGYSRAETISNFLKVFHATKHEINEINPAWFMDFETGWTELIPKFYAEVMRKMGTKEICQAENVYPDIDLLSLTDQVTSDGKLKSVKASLGLHIHFASVVEDERTTQEYKYTPINIPISVGGAETMLCVHRKEHEETHTLKVIVNRITNPVIKHIVKKFDDEILGKYVPVGIPLKYRNKGFYEVKPYGFEYRSLPFNQMVYEDLWTIVDFAYKQLEEL